MHTKILGCEILTLVFAHYAFINPLIGSRVLCTHILLIFFRFKYEQSLLEKEIQLYRFSQKYVARKVFPLHNMQCVLGCTVVFEGF